MRGDDRPLRILVGAVEVGGQLLDFADGFRQLGHQVTTLINERRHSYFASLKYDVDIGVAAADRIAWPRIIAESQSPLIRGPRGIANRAAKYVGLMSLIARHDVFVYHRAGIGLTVGNREYSLLKALGKRIVVVCLGPDVRYMPAYCQQFDEMTYSDEVVDVYRADSLEPFWNLRRAELYADVVISVPNQAALAIRPYIHLYVLIKLVDYRFAVPGREIPVVVHAPSVTGAKGTKQILAALDRIRAEGVQFELRLLQGVQNAEVVKQLTDADVLIDQLYFPLHGKLSVEGMASGCAVATANRSDYEPYPPNRPLWHIDRGNVEAALRRLLTDRELRVSLARDGRRHVETHHAHVEAVKRVANLMTATTVERYDHYPSFFTRSFRLPTGVQLPQRIKDMTSEIVRRWGLPEDVDPDDVANRGLMSVGSNRSLEGIPRWRTVPNAS